jgi:Fe2+ or Zn2+ uptake regulation protein
MIDKFKELVEELDEKETSNLIIILSLLLETWEDGKINLYSEIQDFELTTIYKVLNLFHEQAEDAS